MKRILSYSAVIISLGLTASTALAQTIAPGPYYATPSWDQQLPASTRFIVLSNWGNAAVLDRETGLVWERGPNGSGTWNAGTQLCAGRPTGGRFSWRLPTLDELSSLLDPTQSSPALPPGHPFQSLGGFGTFWTANSHVELPDFAWHVNFAAAGVGITSKGTGRFFWCVRGSSSGSTPQ
jgi:Protein of unknown function (DUF1566)